MKTNIAHATFVAALLSLASTAAIAQVTGSAPAYNCGVSATTAGAGTACINGGGSTLAKLIYSTTTAVSGYNGEMTTYAAGTGGAVGFYYEGAGSGAGQSAVALNDPNQWANGDAVDAFTVHFGASDAYIVAGSGALGSYIGANKNLPAGGGQFIQIPYVATPITIPVVNAKMTANGKITLNDTDLCGIFSGKITNWNQTSAKGTTTAGAINVAWRDDNGGSGTTFLLTQHLAGVCTTANTAGSTTFKGFSATTKFATLFTGYTGPASSSDTTTLWTIPSTSLQNNQPNKGSGGVATYLTTSTTTSAIGYLSPDYTAIASVNATGAYSKLYVAELLNAKNNTAYAPTVAAVNTAIQNVGTVPTGTPSAPPTTAALAAIQTNWVPHIITPSSGYPIVGYTNLLFVQCYKSSTVANAIKGLVTNHLNGVYSTMLQSNGFVPLIGGATSGWGKAVYQTFIASPTVKGSGSNGWNLDINNATACKNVTAR